MNLKTKWMLAVTHFISKWMKKLFLPDHRSTQPTPRSKSDRSAHSVEKSQICTEMYKTPAINVWSTWFKTQVLNGFVRCMTWRFSSMLVLRCVVLNRTATLCSLTQINWGLCCACAICLGNAHLPLHVIWFIWISQGFLSICLAEAYFPKNV